jgi:tyrosine-protein phosphatase non-receptor type 13 protein
VSLFLSPQFDNATTAKKPTSRRRRMYIAAQGCMQNTIADFWHMVWQEKCSVIAMLTAVTENGKVSIGRFGGFDWLNDFQ